MSDQTVQYPNPYDTAHAGPYPRPYEHAPQPAEPALPTPPVPPTPAPPPAADGVVRLGGGGAPAVDTEPLFELDGVTYSIPKRVGANVALRVMARFEQAGEVSAQIHMLRTVLGAEAFDALMGCDDLTPEQFEAISDRVQDLVLSSAKSAAGK